MSRERNTNGRDSKSNSARPARVPMQSGGKLTVPEGIKEEGYFYYWALDRNGMIERLQAAYYEPVLDSRNEQITVMAGGGSKHYLMRLPMEYYNEDMEAQQSKIDAAMNKDIKLKKGEYSPFNKSSAVTREPLQV
jgi:hypothetical protein